MADLFDLASEHEQVERDLAIARALAMVPASEGPRSCDHCEEFPRAPGSSNCVRCDLELADER